VLSCLPFGERSNAFNPGDKIKIRVNCKVNKDINHINVGIRIRNKEGVKIYSWGTLNQDMFVRFNQLEQPQFWEREFKAGERFHVDMEFECTLEQTSMRYRLPYPMRVHQTISRNAFCTGVMKQLSSMSTSCAMNISSVAY
jgi:LEA14-like dessication related protein